MLVYIPAPWILWDRRTIEEPNSIHVPAASEAVSTIRSSPFAARFSARSISCRGSFIRVETPGGVELLFINIYTLTLRTRKIRRVALKTQGFKTKPKVFLFPQISRPCPKCSDFINAVGPQKVLHFCPVYWSSTPKHKPNTQQKHIIFSPVPRGSNTCLYHGCTRVNHGLNMGWTRVRENLVIFKIHEV